MALKQDQIERLGASYQLLEPRLDQLVSDFYDRLFLAAPQVRSMFPQDMSNQKQHLGGAIKLVAKHIANIDQLAQPLREMGARHVGYGAQEAHYPVVRDTLVASMAEISGYAWTQNLTNDWTAALNAVAGYMLEGAQAHEQNQQAKAA